jgi:hypothetical protein
MLLIEGTLRDEELIGEASQTPSGLAVGKDTSLELVRHVDEVKEHSDLNHPIRVGNNKQ